MVTRKTKEPAKGNDDGGLADPQVTRQHGFKRKQKMNTSLISMSHTAYLTIRVLGTVHDAPMPSLAKNEDGTIPVVRVCDLETGEVATLIVPAVFRSILDDDGNYVGKCYELIRGEVVQGKNYRQIEVWEIDDPNPERREPPRVEPEHEDYETRN